MLLFRINAAAYAIFCVVFSLYGCEIKQKAVANQSNAAATNSDVFYMDLKNPAISQNLADLRSPGKYKFVEIEVVKVVNTGQYETRLEVYYEPEGEEEKTLLGTFSLFPADNPGLFIVPTQGKLKSGGKLTLLLVRPEGAPKDAEIRIGVKEMRLKE